MVSLIGGVGLNLAGLQGSNGRFHVWLGHLGLMIATVLVSELKFLR